MKTPEEIKELQEAHKARMEDAANQIREERDSSNPDQERVDHLKSIEVYHRGCYNTTNSILRG